MENFYFGMVLEKTAVVMKVCIEQKPNVLMGPRPLKLPPSSDLFSPSPYSAPETLGWYQGWPLLFVCSTCLPHTRSLSNPVRQPFQYLLILNLRELLNLCPKITAFLDFLWPLSPICFYLELWEYAFLWNLSCVLSWLFTIGVIGMSSAWIFSWSGSLWELKLISYGCSLLPSEDCLRPTVGWVLHSVWSLGLLYNVLSFLQGNAYEGYFKYSSLNIALFSRFSLNLCKHKHCTIKLCFLYQLIHIL